MANTLTVPPRPSLMQRWLPALAIALLIVAVLAGAAWLWFMSQRAPRANPTIQPALLVAAEPSQVPPHLALLMLAGYPPEQVWQEALRQGEWEGSLAMWLFSPIRPDREAIAQLIQFAEAQAAQAPDAAATCLLAAADLTRLSPELNDRERAERLLEIGKALQGLGLPAAAVTEWRQASILAHFGPSMPSLYRAILLQELATLYRQVGASRLEARARQNAAQVGSAHGELAVPARIVLDTEALPPEPPELAAARQQRQQAAQAAARALATPEEAAAYGLLRDALSAEGLLHRTWLEQTLRASPPREVQAALLLYHIGWLQQERLLALGYGGPHFPTWQARQPQIEAELHEAWAALEMVRLDQSILGGVQEDATLAQRDWWATWLVQARLARDPLLESAALLPKMVPNNADAAGGAILRLDWIQGRWWRVPRETVGRNRLPE